MLDGDSLNVVTEFILQRRFDEAEALLDESRLGDLPGWTADFMAAVREPGNQPDLERAVWTRAADVAPPTLLGSVLAAMDSDLIAEQIGADCSDVHSLFNLWHPAAGRLRGSERVFDVLEAIGLVDYWRANGWPDRCADLPQDRVDCPG